MLPPTKRHEIQVLRRAGLTQERIADVAGVSVRTIRRVAAETPIHDLADAPPSRAGRPSVAAPFRQAVRAMLEEDPRLISLEILRRARLDGYAGGKSALYALVRTLRSRTPRPLVRFEGLAGEFSQHDFGEVEVRFLDGRRRRIDFFASRLKFSRWVEVSLVPDQRAETLVRAFVEHLDRFGGIPLLAVFDRPKTVALSWARDGSVVEWNPTFAAAVLDLGIGVELCWPRSPRQKGSVENLVGWVKGSFFKQRRFLDEEDLLRQLAEWLAEANTVRPCRATGVPPSARIAEERARLRPLRVAPGDLAVRVPVFVGPSGYVLHDTRSYSMPAEAIALPATLYLYRDGVRIVAGRFEALHPRLREPHTRSTLPEHRASHLAKVSGKRAVRYLKREHLLDLGDEARDLITEVVARRPRAWMPDIDALHDLLQREGPDRLRDAIRRALEARVYGAEYVARLLAGAPPAELAG